MMTGLRNCQSVGVMIQEGQGPLKSFHTIVAGNTLGAHCAFIRKLEAIGQTEVTSREPYDYSLVFCPIVSRVGTDISEAMGKIPSDKPAILVVMHHTVHADSFVGDSSRHVTKLNVILTVDCLFHDGLFLNCSRNDIAFHDIERFVGRHQPQVYNVDNVFKSQCNSCRDYKCLIIIVLVILLIIQLFVCRNRH